MKTDFESVFAAMADRAIAKSKMPPKVDGISEAERFSFLEEWRTSWECAQAWDIENANPWLHFRLGEQVLEVRKPRRNKTRGRPAWIYRVRSCENSGRE